MYRWRDIICQNRAGWGTRTLKWEMSTTYVKIIVDVPTETNTVRKLS